MSADSFSDTISGARQQIHPDNKCLFLRLKEKNQKSNTSYAAFTI